MARSKVTVVGAGNVGATCAHWIASHELADVGADRHPRRRGKGQGARPDRSQPVMKFDLSITGGSDYALSAESDVVVITGGVPRKKDPVTGQFPAAMIWSRPIRDCRRCGAAGGEVFAERDSDHRLEPAGRDVPRRAARKAASRHSA